MSHFQQWEGIKFKSMLTKIAVQEVPGIIFITRGNRFEWLRYGYHGWTLSKKKNKGTDLKYNFNLGVDKIFKLFIQNWCKFGKGTLSATQYIEYFFSIF